MNQTLHEKLEAKLIEIEDRLSRVEKLMPPCAIEKAEELGQLHFPSEYRIREGADGWEVEDENR